MAERIDISAMPQLIEAFRVYLSQDRGRRPRTVETYLHVIESLADFLRREHGEDGGVLIDAVDKTELARFLRGATKAGREPSHAVWNVRLSALRSFFGYLVREEVIDMNPALRLDPQRVFPREPIPLDFDEMIRLVEATNAAPRRYRERNAAIVQVFFHAGVRVSEIVSLDLDRVDFDRYLFLDLRVKGGKPIAVDFNDVVAEALDLYLAVRRVKPNERALFVSNRGSRISRRAVQELVSRYAERAGIQRRVSPHTLRHSCVSELADLGAPISAIQKHVGHASVRTTERYIHVKSRAAKRAVDDLGASWKRHVRIATRGAPKPRGA